MLQFPGFCFGNTENRTLAREHLWRPYCCLYEGIIGIAQMWEGTEALSASILSPLLVIVILLSCKNDDRRLL